MLPPLPLWPQLSTWLQLLEGHGGYTRGCSTLTRGWPQYPSNPAPASSTSVCAAPGGVCRELHSCGAATEPCECLLRGAARTLQLHAALCGAGTPAAAPGRGTLASFARPRGICKLCRVTPARPAAHCKAVQKFAQLPHIPRRPVNPHTAAPKPCNRDSQGGGLLHTYTLL